MTTRVHASRPHAVSKSSKSAAATKPVSKSDAAKVRSIVQDAYGSWYVSIDSTVYPKIKISTVTATAKPNVFKVTGSVHYQAWNGGDMGQWDASLKATVNTKSGSISGNIPIDP